MKTLELSLLKYNKHWEDSYFYPYKIKRKLFQKLIPFIEKRQIIEITGLRRVGKTTVLFQVINYLLQKTDRLKILYFTFDEEVTSLDKLFASFSQQAGVDYKTEKIFVFLDEVQKLENFQNQVKTYYDLYPNIKFFLSGSFSLFLKKKKQESLAGRIFSFRLPPLDFEEYLLFRGKKEVMDKPLLFKNEIEKEFEIFLKTQFVESIELKNEALKKEYFVSIMRKIIFEDIPLIFPVENPQILWQMVKIIAQRPGIMINFQSLASDLGISNKTVSLYLYYLEEAFLIKKLYNFSKNLLTSEKKLKKYYLASPSFSAALTDFQETSLLAENLIVSLKDISFFWRDVYKNEVNFVETKEGNVLPIEIKYKKNIQQKELKNLILFLKRFNLSKGKVYSKEVEERKLLLGNKTINIKPIFFCFH